MASRRRPSPPRLESLEDRWTPDGQVVVGPGPRNDLTVKGDGQANQIVVTPVDATHIKIAGAGNTTVVGGDNVDVSGKVIRFAMGAGADRVTFDGTFDLLGLDIDLGTGDDEVQAFNGTLGVQDLTVRQAPAPGAAGSTRVLLAADDTKPGDALHVGNDFTYQSRGAVNDALKVGLAGAGSFVHGDLVTDVGAGNNTVDIRLDAAENVGSVALTDQSAAGQTIGVNLAAGNIARGLAVGLGLGGGQAAFNVPGGVGAAVSVKNNALSRAGLTLTGDVAFVQEGVTVTLAGQDVRASTHFGSVRQDVGVSVNATHLANVSVTLGSVDGAVKFDVTQPAREGAQATIAALLSANFIGKGFTVRSTGPGTNNTTVAVTSTGAASGGAPLVSQARFEGATGSSAVNSSGTIGGPVTISGRGVDTSANLNAVLGRVSATIAGAASGQVTVGFGGSVAVTMSGVGQQGVGVGSGESLSVNLSRIGTGASVNASNLAALSVNANNTGVPTKVPFTIGAAGVRQRSNITLTGVDSSVSLGSGGAVSATIRDDASPTVEVGSAESVKVTVTDSGNTTVSATGLVSSVFTVDLSPAAGAKPQAVISASTVGTADGGGATIRTRNADTDVTVGLVRGGPTTVQIVGDDSPDVTVGTAEDLKVNVTNSGPTTLDAGTLNGYFSVTLAPAAPATPVTVSLDSVGKDFTYGSRGADTSISVGAVGGNATVGIMNDASPTVDVGSAEDFTANVTDADGPVTVHLSALTGNMVVKYRNGKQVEVPVNVTASSVGGAFTYDSQRADTSISVGTVVGPVSITAATADGLTLMAVKLNEAVRVNLTNMHTTTIGVQETAKDVSIDAKATAANSSADVDLAVANAGGNVNVTVGAVPSTSSAGAVIKNMTVNGNLNVKQSGAITAVNLNNVNLVRQNPTDTSRGNLTSTATGKFGAVRLSGVQVDGTASFNGTGVSGKYQVSIDDSVLKDTVSVTGGSGDDTLTMDTLDSLSADTEVMGDLFANLGAGDDKVTFGGKTGQNPDPARKVVFGTAMTVGVISLMGGPGEDTVFNLNAATPNGQPLNLMLNSITETTTPP